MIHQQTLKPKSDVLTVVPCLNEARNIASLLRTLLADDANQCIVVADGGSTDGSREIVRHMALLHGRIVLLENPERIQSAGVNRAVQKHGHAVRWLARIDAHCRYPDRYVSHLVETAVRREADAVVVRLNTKGKNSFGRGVAAAQNSLLGTGGSAHRTRATGAFVEHGHHALISVCAFKQAGGYCEGMPCNEDAELDLRLLKNGHRIWLEPDPPVIYFPRENPLALFKQYFRYGVGRATTLRRHRIRRRLRQALPLAIAPACVLALFSVLVPVLALPFLAWFALCQAWGFGIAVRERSLAAAWSGSAAAVMHLAWSAGYWRQDVGALLSGGRNLPAPALPFSASRSHSRKSA